MDIVSMEDLKCAVQQLGWGNRCSVGEPKEGKVCLIGKADAWEIFYYERGQKWDVLELQHEQTAILVFFGWASFEKYRSGKLA